MNVSLVSLGLNVFLYSAAAACCSAIAIINKEERETQLVIIKTKSIIFLSKSHWMCVELTSNLITFSCFRLRRQSLHSRPDLSLSLHLLPEHIQTLKGEIPESLVEMSPYAGARYDDKFLRNLISYMSSV